ncbi:MAG: hypothetical protein KDC35_01735 [Acidobacteria bacterium]|nr:hypothetical protein [Acidobacteriota bacterium]
MINSSFFKIAIAGLIGTTSFGGVSFFVNDIPGFDTARGSTVLAGTEDFESSTLGPNMIATLPDPLAPGVANTPFPTGTNPATGMTVQTNSLGGAPASPMPGGFLATASVGLLGTPTDQVSTSTPLDASFDMIFALPQTRAVRFIPLVFDDASSGNPGTATIRVYDSSNVLLGTLTDVAVAGFMNPTTVIGVVATGGDDIGRINIFATTAIDNYSGADDIFVYTGNVPVELLSFEIE